MKKNGAKIFSIRCRAFHHIIMSFALIQKGILKKGYKDMNTFHLTVCHSTHNDDRVRERDEQHQNNEKFLNGKCRNFPLIF